MKRLLVPGAVVLAACALLAAGCGGGTKTFGISDTNITVKTGEQFIIQLESNRTTGFQWGITKTLDPAIVKKIKTTYTVKGGKKLVGAGGTEQWTFQAVGPGSTKIVMGYSRPFERGKTAARVATFNVTVQ